MSDISDCIIKILADNGVSVEQEEIWSLAGKVENVIQLDFSEHDKVFEDKIADLQQRIRELIKEKDEYKRKCNNFGFENQDLKKITKGYEDKIADLEGEIVSLKAHMLRIRERCTDGARRHFENGTYGCLTVVNRNGDLELENKELKQRIAELESKETGKQKKRTGVIVARVIDGQEYVGLDDFMSVVNDLQAEIGT